MSAPLPKAGDLVIVGRAASVQFLRPISCRVIRVLDWITYDGWCWLDVYQLNAKGDAVARRSIYVQPAGLEVVQPAPVARVPRRVGVPPNVRRGPAPAGMTAGGRGAVGVPAVRRPSDGGRGAAGRG
ncbi:hypothetical protein GA0070623_4957 [Micromonospora rifamycinica]|uniref:Uncharacterized protein n=1 Tax=Micromonospora rifamycinica TaxID=291594 RepID=A0A1C5KBL4_9ACTN|nr:hypothetical protein GA0070623_4957 [Micromonospora rifamycinica]